MRLVLFCLFCCLEVVGQNLIGEQKLELDWDAPVRRVEATSAFRALGLVTDEHGHGRVRASVDGQIWTAWQDVELGHEGGSLVWFDEPVRWVELVGVRSVKLLFIEPGKQKASLEARRATAGDPEIVGRAGWGCGNECAPRERPVFANVTHLVVHHSAGTNEARDWAAVIRSIWVLHVQGNGWNDIGYNYLIDPNGVIYEGRQGGDGVIGAHFSGVNTATMGVCMVGTYTSRAPGSMAVESLRKLLTWQAAKWKLDATGQTLHAASGLTLNVVSGHRDAGLSPRASGTTECPGNTLYTFLPGIRSTAAAAASCQIQLARRNYCLSGQASVIPIEFENPRGCEVGVENGADWLTIKDGNLEASPNPGPNRRSADLKIGGQIMQVVQAEAGVNAMPCPARGSVVNGASFDTRPLARGAIASLFGTGLEGGRVIVNGNLSATVFASTDNQLNFALPASVQPGSARLVVEKNGVRSPELMFWVTEAAPAAFAAQNFDDGLLNTPQSPVKAGRPLVVYVTGIGTNRNLPWEVRVGGLWAEGLYLGSTPGFLGLAQANLIVPETLGAGSHPLEVVVSGAASPELRVAVVK